MGGIDLADSKRSYYASPASTGSTLCGLSSITALPMLTYYSWNPSHVRWPGSRTTSHIWTSIWRWSIDWLLTSAVTSVLDEGALSLQLWQNVLSQATSSPRWAGNSPVSTADECSERPRVAAALRLHGNAPCVKCLCAGRGVSCSTTKYQHSARQTCLPYTGSTCNINLRNV